MTSSLLNAGPSSCCQGQSSAAQGNSCKASLLLYIGGVPAGAGAPVTPEIPSFLVMAIVRALLPL